jgi:hypothetical protein
MAWAASSPVDDAYSTLNPQWNGTSELAARGFAPVSAGLERTLSVTGAPAILLEIGPSRQFTEVDVDSIRAFLERGGMLLIADNSGSGNGLLELLGFPARFDGRLLADSLFYRKQTVFPVSTDLPSSQYSTGVNELVLDYATVLNITSQENVSVLASSSAFSFLDLNRDGLKDPDEPSGPFPVLAELTTGKGNIILFTSPASLANGLIHEGDNSVFMENIIQRVSQPTPAALLLDETHLEPSPFTPAKVFAKGLVASILQGNMGLTSKLGLASLTISVVAARFAVRKPVPQKGTSKPYRTVQSFDTDSVIQLHPGWNRRQLEYVARELEASMKWRHLHERE